MDEIVQLEATYWRSRVRFGKKKCDLAEMAARTALDSLGRVITLTPEKRLAIFQYVLAHLKGELPD